MLQNPISFLESDIENKEYSIPKYKIIPNNNYFNLIIKKNNIKYEFISVNKNFINKIQNENN